MVKRRRAILIAMITIVLCLSLVAAGTYALYTDSVNLTTHLKSGSMDITLIRTNLTTKTLSADTGYLVVEEYPDDVDFSVATDRNVFEVTDETLVAPGCSFDAELTLSNRSDVAFVWWLEIKYDDSEDLALADQLKVTVTAGTPSEALLSAGLTIGSETVPVGTLAKGGSSVFYVKVEFIDDDDVNNDAQGQQVDFDLIVHAVQATDAV